MVDISSMNKKVATKPQFRYQKGQKKEIFSPSKFPIFAKITILYED